MPTAGPGPAGGIVAALLVKAGQPRHAHRRRQERSRGVSRQGRFDEEA